MIYFDRILVRILCILVVAFLLLFVTTMLPLVLFVNLSDLTFMLVAKGVV